MAKLRLTPSVIIAMVLVAAALLLAAEVASWGMADYYARPAENQLDLWAQGKLTLGHGQWLQMQTQLARAVSLDPRNPKILRAYGNALEGPYASYPPGAAAARPIREEAANFYRKATSVRPTWPYAWADLAMVKYRLNELDTEFFHAMYTARETGPEQLGVLRVLDYVGLKTWGRLPSDPEHFVLDVITDSLHYPDRNFVSHTLDQINRQNLLEPVCLLVTNVDQVQQYCRQHQHGGHG